MKYVKVTSNTIVQINEQSFNEHANKSPITVNDFDDIEVLMDADLPDGIVFSLSDAQYSEIMKTCRGS